jgi:hypothetical protein
MDSGEWRFGEEVVARVKFSAGILEQSIRARNRVGIGLSYRPARLLIGWQNHFLGIDSWAT